MVDKRSVIFDTNVLAYFFEGNKEAGKIIHLSDVIISSITFIEMLSSKKMPAAKRGIMEDFLQSFTIIETNPLINKIAVDLRLKYSLDTPDAIIAATAWYRNVKLVTADKIFFKISSCRPTHFLLSFLYTLNNLRKCTYSKQLCFRFVCTINCWEGLDD